MSNPLPQLLENRPPVNLLNRINQQGNSIVLPIFVITILTVLATRTSLADNSAMQADLREMSLLNSLSACLLAALLKSHNFSTSKMKMGNPYYCNAEASGSWYAVYPQIGEMFYRIMILVKCASSALVNNIKDGVSNRILQSEARIF